MRVVPKCGLHSAQGLEDCGGEGLRVHPTAGESRRQAGDGGPEAQERSEQSEDDEGSAPGWTHC